MSKGKIEEARIDACVAVGRIFDLRADNRENVREALESVEREVAAYLEAMNDEEGR
jgi:hypothetical protein